ncbi:hypothetical protein [Parapedobacter soli]|uniref:hypothetical protein n=1 Tax=Parapedobacter soli TaxID=416955 RepID=UPI0021C813A5|nr:hypothetical protein [Parapedobacter soli]
MQYPFTSIGVQDWQTHLYAQPDPDIRNEAEFAYLHFEDWVTQRFSLDQSQRDYLHNLDYATIRFAADGVYFAITHRLPIVLEKDEKPVVRGAKLATLIKEFEGSDGEARNTSFTGRFIVRITY